MTPAPPEPLEGFAIMLPYRSIIERKWLSVIERVFGKAEASFGDFASKAYFRHLLRL